MVSNTCDYKSAPAKGLNFGINRDYFRSNEDGEKVYPTIITVLLLI